MSGTSTVVPDTPDLRRIYEFVERSGAVEARDVWEHFEMDPVQFQHQLAVLRRDGYLEKRDGRLRVVLDAGTDEEHSAGDVSFVIRPARQEDLSSIVGAIRTVAGERRYIVAETVAEQLRHEGVLLRNNDRLRRMFFVATAENEVVGWAHCQTPNVQKLRHTAELTVGVLEEYRRHGIGSHLLQRGLQWAASNGCEKVYDSLPATNPDGITFLLENGWNIESVRSDHYKLDRGLIDEVMLAHQL